MPWFKVDDGFHGHPKVMMLSPSAIGLWLLAGTWSAQYLTDGLVPAGMVRRFGGTPEDAADLVNASLWHEADSGYQFHEWAEYQPLKSDVEAERAASRERMRAVRAKRKGVAAEVVQENADDGAGDVRPNNGERSGDVRANKSERADVVRSGSVEVRVTPTQPSPSPSPSLSDEREVPSSAVAVATPRPDVEALLDLLESEVVSNGGKAPARNGKNRDAMRLLLDKDGRTVEQVETAIRWCQRDEFWRSNILSASKLREKYDQLRLAAQRRPSAAGAPSRAAARQASNLEVVSRMAALDAADEGDDGPLAVSA